MIFSSSRYQRLPGTARRYLDTQTKHTLSRRAYDDLRGIVPESQAKARRAAGTLRQQRPRRDKGTVRLPLNTLLLGVTEITVQRVPGVSRTYAVVKHHIVVGKWFTSGHVPSQRHHCDTCLLSLRSPDAMVRHIASAHVVDAGASVLFTGDVRTNERRTRMPWRVHALEYD